jgi:hypothetical protein
LLIRPSASKHGVTNEAIAHAVTYAIYIDEDYQGDEPPKILFLGPDPAGNMLEVLGRFGESDRALGVFHAMAARPGLLALLNRKKATE